MSKEHFVDPFVVPDEPLIFTEQTKFLGRNGICKCNGVNITLCDSEKNTKVVVLEPVTSKMLIGRCNIEIPKADLKRFILTLETFL